MGEIELVEGLVGQLLLGLQYDAFDFDGLELRQVARVGLETLLNFFTLNIMIL